MGAYLGFLKAKARREHALEQPTRKLSTIDACLAHRRKRRREIALGEAPAVIVHDQRVMQIGRLGQAKQFLQKALDGR